MERALLSFSSQNVKGVNLINVCSSQLVLISFSLAAHVCFHMPFRLQSNITARDQSPINQML